MLRTEILIENKTSTFRDVLHSLSSLPRLFARFSCSGVFCAAARNTTQTFFLMADYGINGFGRIVRNVLRAMSQKQVERVRAINDLTDTHTLAHLLKWDSVHGKFDGEIGYDQQNIIVRSHKIKILKERDPANLPWKDLGVAVVLESTGFFTSRDKAELHITKGGAKRVLISAPAKNPDVTICLGAMAKVLHDGFGIAHGFMSTIHSYTNDQRILDLPHEDLRRARAAAISIIPSSTG